MRRQSIIVGIIIALSYISIRPILSAGFFPMHDDTQAGRVVAMGRALRNGQFPVRWVSDLGYGYGYPLFNFYGPLPYYVGGGLYALGVNGLLATKIMFVVGVVGAGLTMYILANLLFGPWAGLVSAVAYVYAPYHAVQIYVRGAVGEYWSLIFLPLVLYGIVLVFRSQRVARGMIVGSFGLAGVILSHTILGYVTSFMVSMGIVFYVLSGAMQGRLRWQVVRGFLGLLFLGLGLSLFFWLPALIEMGLTNVYGQIESSSFWKDHFVCLNQLWNSPWGFGGSVRGCVDGMSFKLGKVHVVLAFLGIIFGLFLPSFSKIRRIVFMITVFFVISVGLMLPFSEPIWRILPFMPFVQYPWRFLTYSIVALSLLASIPIVAIRYALPRRVLSIIGIMVIIVFNRYLFQPQYLYAKPPAAFESNEELRYRVSRISDEYLPRGFIGSSALGYVAHEIIDSPQFGSVEIERDTEIMTKAKIILSKFEIIHVNRVHFPGWRYYIDGKESVPRVLSALPTLAVPEGTHTIEMKFTDTPIRTFGNLGTLLSLLIVVVLLARYEKAFT